MNGDTERPFSTSEALRFGWAKTLANLKPLLTIGAIGAFLALLNQALMGSGDRTGARPLLGLVVQVLQAGVTMAFIRVALKLHDGQPIDLSHPAELLAGFFTYLLTSILYFLIVAGGLLLLVVPGVIWALRYGFATFLVLDKKTDPVEALRESGRLTRGVKGQLLAFALLMFCVNLLGAIALGIGLLVTIPTTFIAAAYVLRKLQARAAAGAQPAPRAPPFTPQTPATNP